MALNYPSVVDGKTRIGSKNNPQGSMDTVFTNESKMIGVYQKTNAGKWELLTMYPDP